MTYNRSYWISIIFCLGIFMIFLSKSGRKRVLISFMIITLLISVISVSFVGAGGMVKEYLSSFSGRFVSLFAGERMYRDETLESRRYENEYILNKIKKSPLIGIGMVSQLRPSIFLSREESGVYIHNSYLWVFASMGLFGFLTFFWFYISFLKRSFFAWKKVKDVFLKAALSGFVLSSIGVLPMAIVNPVFMQWKSIVIIATMMGLVVSIINVNRSESKG